jgi:hypothetical protein
MRSDSPAIDPDSDGALSRIVGRLMARPLLMAVVKGAVSCSS